jgi:hypothetical protein
MNMDHLSLLSIFDFSQMGHSTILKVHIIPAKLNVLLYVPEVWTHTDIVHIRHHLSEVWNKGPW